MAREDPTIYMRVPQDLKDALDKAAERNGRSLTAEVVARLRVSFETPDGDRLESTATVVADQVKIQVQVGLLRERIQRLKDELEVTLSNAKARQMMAEMFFEEMSKLDDGTNSLAFRQMRLAEHMERQHVISYETRAEMLRSDLKRAEADYQRVMQAEQGAQRPTKTILVGTIGREDPSPTVVKEAPERPAPKRRFVVPKKK